MTCKRCGKCCMTVGSDFWQGFWKDDDPCDMLQIKDGIAICKIHDNKPEVCREYPSKDDDFICMESK